VSLPQYNWNMSEVGVNHQSIDQLIDCPHFCIHDTVSLLI
jgi:hypothetical protein